MTKQISATQFNTHCAMLFSVNYRTLPGETRFSVCDKMSVIKTLITNIWRLTRAKKALRCLKGTRELNLYLTIPATKPNNLCKELKNITGIL